MKKKWQDVKFETVTVRMPAVLSLKLDAEAVRRNTTKAELVREAVDAYLNGRETPARRQCAAPLAHEDKSSTATVRCLPGGRKG